MRSDRLRMFFVVHHAWETYVMPTTSFVKKGGRRLFFNERFSSTVALCPLAEAEGVHGDVEVYEALMGGASGEEAIELSLVLFRQVTVPKRAPKIGDDTVDDSAGSEEDSMEEWGVGGGGRWTRAA